MRASSDEEKLLTSHGVWCILLRPLGGGQCPAIHCLPKADIIRAGCSKGTRLNRRPRSRQPLTRGMSAYVGEGVAILLSPLTTE
jgi:hypothetical protein